MISFLVNRKQSRQLDLRNSYFIRYTNILAFHVSPIPHYKIMDFVNEVEPPGRQEYSAFLMLLWLPNNFQTTHKPFQSKNQIHFNPHQASLQNPETTYLL